MSRVGWGLCVVLWITCAGEPVMAQVKTLRLAFHVFQDDGGSGNFHQDSLNERRFLDGLTEWVNYKLGHLDTLQPEMPSPYIPDGGFRIRLDTVYYHRDTHAWDCSNGIDAPYMRELYVDQDTQMTYRQKYRTLPVFIGGNHPVTGGETMGLGDKGYIAVRGYYYQYISQGIEAATDECGRNLVHELGHCLGLPHNFSGGPNGEQCDNCEDNGCPVEGSSNNIMDYWPLYGHALSLCQYEIIQTHLRGERGDIAEVIVNDSCHEGTGQDYLIAAGDSLVVRDTVYSRSSIIVQKDGALIITGYLSMPAGCPVILEPGSLFEISGGRIGNLCGDLWPGVSLIQISPEDHAEIRISNGGGIDNAWVAIRSDTRSLVKLERAAFRNSVQTIILTGVGNDTSYMVDSEFLTTSKINRYEEGTTPVSFIEATGSGVLQVSGCGFVNEPGTYLFDADYCGSGIIADGFGLEIGSSEFRNLFRGVGGICPDPSRGIEITGNEFIHNRCGLHISTGGLVRVENNLFQLQRFNEGSTIGLRLERPDRFVINKNRFESIYGSGSMAGISLFRPASTSSLVSGNEWKNLPLGIFIDGPPPVDSLLLAASATGSDLAGFVDFGPQLLDNSFYDTPVKLALIHDSINGISIGYPSDYKTVTGTFAWNRPVGGYAPYSDSLFLSAFNGWNNGHDGLEEDGFYFFMNYINLEEGKGRKAEGRNQGKEYKIKGVRDLKDAGEYLSDYIMISRLIEDPGFPDIFRLLPELVQVPAILRSGHLSAFSDRFTVDQKPWLLETLTGIAGSFVKGDSLLASCAARQAYLNDSLWRYPAVTLPTFVRNMVPEWSDYPADRYDLPDLRFFRFAQPPVVEGLPPAFDLWPNPAEEVVYIHPQKGYAPGPDWRLRISSSSGRNMMTRRIAGWEDLIIRVADLPAGLYIAMLSDTSRNLGSRKFIKIK